MHNAKSLDAPYGLSVSVCANTPQRMEKAPAL